MSPVEIIQTAQATSLLDEDGERIAMELLPPLSAGEIEDFADGLPFPRSQAELGNEIMNHEEHQGHEGTPKPYAPGVRREIHAFRQSARRIAVELFA